MVIKQALGTAASSSRIRSRWRGPLVSTLVLLSMPHSMTDLRLVACA